jgi:hypothetical protein
MMRSALLCGLLAAPVFADDPKCLRQCAEMIKELDAACRKEPEGEARQQCLAMKTELDRDCKKDCKQK